MVGHIAQRPGLLPTKYIGLGSSMEQAKVQPPTEARPEIANGAQLLTQPARPHPASQVHGLALPRCQGRIDGLRSKHA